MNRIIVAIVFISVVLIIDIYSVNQYKNNPQISVKFNVFSLTDEEFMYVGTKGLDNSTKNDFKNIEFTLYGGVCYERFFERRSILD